MTKRERFLAFANFKPVDRVPRRASYIKELRDKMTGILGEDPMTHFDMDDGAGAFLVPPEGYTPPDYSRYYPDYVVGKDNFTLDSNGVGHLGHGFHHFTEYISPLKNAQSFRELEEFPIPSRKHWLNTKMVQVGKAAHANKDYAKIVIGHTYETAWQIRGYEEFLMDLMTQRDWAEYLLEKICENHIYSAVAAAKAGYDCLGFGDDVANQNAMMFQPDLWREVLKPRWARVVAAARAHKPDIHIWYHSDGNIWEILDDLVEIGITILNPVQPECMDPVAVRKRMGKNLAFDGCIGTQTTFPFGKPADMHRVVKELCERLDARKGGLMLSPTHVLEPEVPPENIVAFFEACDKA